MRFLFSASLVLPAMLALPAIAQQQASVVPQQPDIIVTGITLDETEAALKACLARNCPPDEDIAASLAHAENLFVRGDYKDARGTTLSSIRRNKRYASEYPVPVSDLLRGNARVAAHLGEGDAYRIGTLDVLSALKAGLENEDPRVLVAKVEVADSFARFGRYEDAEDAYYRVASEAKGLDERVVEGFALLRVATLRSQLAEDDPSRFSKRANESFDELIASDVPQHLPFSRAAQVLKARLAAKSGDSSAIDALIADYRAQGPTAQPVLLYSKPIRYQQESRGSTDGSVTTKIATKDFDDQWVDISFWIAPDGKATDVEIVRESEDLDGNWTTPILESVKSRRYAPLALDPNEPGLLRVERYTFTSRYTTYAGSRLRVREPSPQVEMLDLSTESATPNRVEVETAS